MCKFNNVLSQASGFQDPRRESDALWSIQNVALQILELLAEDAHVETKRGYEGDPSRRSTRSDSVPPLLSGLRRDKQSRT
jgi:IS5 family transposase